MILVLKAKEAFTGSRWDSGLPGIGAEVRGTFRGDEIVPSEGTEVAGGSLVSQTAFGANVRGARAQIPPVSLAAAT